MNTNNIYFRGEMRKKKQKLVKNCFIERDGLQVYFHIAMQK